MEYCEKKTLRNYIDEGLHKVTKCNYNFLRPKISKRRLIEENEL